MLPTIHDVAGVDAPCVECAGYSDKCRLRVPPDDACETLDGRTLCVPCFVADTASRNTDPGRSAVIRGLWERLR